MVTSIFVRKVEERPGVLETLVRVVHLAQQPEPDRAGGQGGGSLPGQVGAGAGLRDAEGGPRHVHVLGAVPLRVVRVPDT